MHGHIARLYKRRIVVIMLMMIIFFGLILLVVLPNRKSNPERDDLSYFLYTKYQPFVKQDLNVGLLTPVPKDVRQIVNHSVLIQVAEAKSNYTLFGAVFIAVLIISIVTFFCINQFRQLSNKLKAQNLECYRLSTQLVDYIASRKDVEQKLRDSEQHYRLLVEAANEGIVVIQEEYLKYVNSKMQDITSLTEEKLLSTFFLDLIHPDDKKLVQNNYLKQIKSDKIKQKYSCRMLKLDGNIRWIEISGAKIEWEGAPATLFFLIDITEQKHIEQQLIESESKFRDMADLLPQIVFELDNEGKLTYVNEHAYRILGYDKTEIKLGHRTHYFHIPEERKQMEGGIQYVLDGLSPIRELEYTMVRKDGSFLKTLIYVNPIIRSNERVGVRGIIVDINKLKEVEQGLRESEQRYRSLVETANEGILVTQHDHFKFANSMFLKMTGYSREELMNISFFEIVHPEDKSLVKTHYNNRLNENEVASRYQFRIYDKNHRVKWVEMNGTLIEWQGGIATLNLATDITERKLTERALIESEENLGKAQQIALIGSWSLNIYTNTFTCSKEFCRIFNTDASTLSSKFDSLIDMIHPEDIQIFRNSMDLDYLIENSDPIEYRIIQSNGAIRTIYAEVKLDLNQVGEPIWCMGIIQDVTERKKAQEEKKLLEQMHNYMQYTTKAIEKERLIISRELHDNLGQALTAIKMDLELLRLHVPDNLNSMFVSKVNKITGQVIETIKTVQHITGKLRPEIIDDLGLGAAIEWYVDDFALRYGIKIRLKIDSVTEVSTDISLTIFRILQESLTNIARYSEATDVCIRLYYTHSNVHFTISDNGIGVNDEQIKSKNSFGILGMAERSQSMGGKFSIARKEKGGTEIKVIIPIFLQPDIKTEC